MARSLKFLIALVLAAIAVQGAVAAPVPEGPAAGAAANAGAAQPGRVTRMWQSMKSGGNSVAAHIGRHKLAYSAGAASGAVIGGMMYMRNKKINSPASQTGGPFASNTATLNQAQGNQLPGQGNPFSGQANQLPGQANPFSGQPATKGTFFPGQH